MPSDTVLWIEYRKVVSTLQVFVGKLPKMQSDEFAPMGGLKYMAKKDALTSKTKIPQIKF